MEKAPVSGAGDCRFQSCHGRKYFYNIKIKKLEKTHLSHEREKGRGVKKCGLVQTFTQGNQMKASLNAK